MVTPLSFRYMDTPDTGVPMLLVTRPVTLTEAAAAFAEKLAVTLESLTTGDAAGESKV